MKNTRFYDISCVILVIFTLGVASSTAYIYLWEKYNLLKFQKLSVLFANIYISLFCGLLLIYLSGSKLMLVLWIIASIVIYIYSIVRLILIIIQIPEEIRVNALSESDNSFFKINRKLKELEINNLKLKNENLRLQNQLREKENVSMQPLNLDAEYKNLVLKYSELEKRFENLQNGLIDRHDQRVEQWKSEQEGELEEVRLNDSSFLRDMGYQITGNSREVRWRVLQKAVAIHGLRKVVRIIDGNIALRVRQVNGRSKYSYAIAEWNHDLSLLKRTYYKGEFSWPTTK